MFLNIILLLGSLYIYFKTYSLLDCLQNQKALRGKYEKSHAQQYRFPERKQLEREGLRCQGWEGSLC